MFLDNIIIKDCLSNPSSEVEFCCSQKNIMLSCKEYGIFFMEKFVENFYTKGIEDLYIDNDNTYIQIMLKGVSIDKGIMLIQTDIVKKNIDYHNSFDMELYIENNVGYIIFKSNLSCENSESIDNSLIDILINIGIKYFIKYNGDIREFGIYYPYIYIIDSLLQTYFNKPEKTEIIDGDDIIKTLVSYKIQYKKDLNEYNKFKEAGYTFKKVKTLDKLKEKQERKICELEKENKKLRLKLKEKAPLNSAFEDEFREEIQKYKNDILFLEEETERCYGEISNLNEELRRLRELYVKLSNSREEQLKKYKHITEWINLLKEESDSIVDIGKEIEGDSAAFSPDNNVSESDLDIFLKSKKIIVSGGHVNWQNKIKEKYPWFTYIDVDNVNFDVNILKTADYIFFNTLHCSHTLYFKFKNNMNVGRNKQDVKDKLIYINNNSLDYFISALEKLLVE